MPITEKEQHTKLTTKIKSVSVHNGMNKKRPVQKIV